MIAELIVDDLLGVSYAVGGRWHEGLSRREQRLDCYGLVIEVLKRAGVTVPDVLKGLTQDDAAALQHGPAAEQFAARLFGRWQRIELPQFSTLNSQCSPPLVAAFRNMDGAAVHAGVLIEPMRFLHCTKGAGVTLNRLDRPPWCDALLGVYRYVDNDEV